MSRSAFAPRLSAGRAMRSLLDDATQDQHEEVAASTARRSLEVGAADDHAEAEADAVAEQVLARIGGSSAAASPEYAEHGAAHVHRSYAGTAPAGRIGAAGGALDDASSSEIESARGGGSQLEAGVRREMEAGFGRSLSDVRIHTDSRADQLSRQMSARAFTTGRDIFFARGEYDPASSSGRHTLAHELAHTVQSGGAVHRKMRGTAEALESQGGGPTTKGVRKKVGSKTNWDKIVAAVQMYEAEEATLLAGGKNPDPVALMTAKPGLLKLLNKALVYIKDWRKANDQDEQDKKQDKKSRSKGDKNTRARDLDVDSDDRTKAPRRQAIAMLEPRVGNEIQLLSSKDSNGWLASLGLNSNQVTGVGRIEGGQVNKKVTEQTYQTESGEFTGFFKQDKGLQKELVQHERTAGIRAVDPNYGARSVALYRLDQLFNAGVTARAEFAVGKDDNGRSVLGTVLESAKGTKAGESQFRRHDEQDGGISLDDPVLQRGLNKLQLLDAIAGQLDRHSNNYTIDTDEDGNVTSVTGIDLDMSFGKDMKTTDRGAGGHYAGIPDFIDKEMGEKILQVKVTDLRDALTGLLGKAEIEATVSRFLEVQQAVKIAQRGDRLRDKWDKSTSGGGPAYDRARWDSKGPQQVVRDSWRERLNKSVDDSARVVLDRAFRTTPRWRELPEPVYASVREAMKFGSWFGDSTSVSYSPPVKLVAGVIFDQNLSDRSTERFLEIVYAEVLNALDVDRISVDLQEALSTADQAKVLAKVREMVDTAFTQKGPALTKRLGALGG